MLRSPVEGQKKKKRKSKCLSQGDTVWFALCEGLSTDPQCTWTLTMEKSRDAACRGKGKKVAETATDASNSAWGCLTNYAMERL